MVSVKEVTEAIERDVFTNKGYYLGKLRDLEIDLSTFRLKSIVVETDTSSEMGKLLGAKRVIIPYSVVQAIGDVVITKHIVASAPQEGEISKEEIQKS
ncbi:MAG: PRC-barrel domain-containing protein [Candidatus Aenigmarchaeota archaeon]|jgi:sporulation protein YlmC with PRC-barrel domain|nr:PRC-barrel domain-containing protein [Candidatus Aenigmarchaeota archaeon]